MNRRSSVRVLSRALARSLSTNSPTPSDFPIKTVTRSNFEPALESLRGHVRAADFVAIDLEMTGVVSAPWRESFEFDRHDVRYLKVKDSAEKFAVVQFGVCPFRWDREKLCFIANPHNFYVFPRQELSVHGPSSEFLCQTSSIDFLAKYQFDFNECIREGISYLSREQENVLHRRLDESSDKDFPNNLKDIRDKPLANMADVFFTERIKNRLKEWRDALLQEGSSKCSNDSVKHFQTIFYNLRPAVSLSGFTAHQLRLIQLVTSKHFEDLAYINLNSQSSGVEHFVVYISSKEDNELLEKEVNCENRKAEEMKINASIGFRHVIDLLSSEKKLIVGHNCFLDIAHIYSKFFGPLPTAMEDFISSFNKHFPHIIDTKVLLNSDDALRMKRSNTSLSSAFAILCPQIALGYRNSGSNPQSSVIVEVQVDDLRVSNWNSGAKHEAGYDAFMTGCVFAQTCSRLGIDFRHVSSISEGFSQNQMLQKHANHLYFTWTSGDIVDLSTGNRVEVQQERPNSSKKQKSSIVFENVLLLWGILPKLKAMDIKDAMIKVFGIGAVVSVYHLDETAVFVQFKKAEQVSKFIALKENLERNNDAISVLNPLWKLFSGGKTYAGDYEVYKEICGFPMSRVLFADQAEALVNMRSIRSKCQNQIRSGDTAGDDYRRHVSVDEIVDSFCVPEGEQIRTSHL